MKLAWFGSLKATVRNGIAKNSVAKYLMVVVSLDLDIAQHQDLAWFFMNAATIVLFCFLIARVGYWCWCKWWICLFLPWFSLRFISLACRCPWFYLSEAIGWLFRGTVCSLPFRKRTQAGFLESELCLEKNWWINARLRTSTEMNVGEFSKSTINWRADLSQNRMA